jgi:hypothetical protein
MPSPAAWLQAYQARALNAGWRIQDIPFLPPGATLVVDAVCIDREVRELPKLGRDTQPRWTGRIVCAYAFGGAEHIATPRLKGAPLDGFARFADEAAVHAFLDARIRPDGRCAVWVDPIRPLCALLGDERR